MRQINPWAKAWANAERSSQKQDLARARWRKSIKQGAEYLEASHRFERTFSDDGVGEFRVMNGRDAKELNEKLFRDYIKAMDKNIAGRSLEKWRLVEKFVETEIKNEQ